MASSTQKQPTPLQKLRVDEIVVSDVGIAGDVAMKVSRALNLERANRVSGWRGLAAQYFHHAPPINTRSCNASPSTPASLSQHLAKQVIKLALQHNSAEAFGVNSHTIPHHHTLE